MVSFDEVLPGVVAEDGLPLGRTVKIIDGLPWFIPPPWIDPTQTARLHSRLRARQLDPVDA